MINESIRDRCHINTNVDSDTFVGINCINGKIEICFPLGFELSGGSDKEIRKDIMLLIYTLVSNSEKRLSEYSKVDQDTSKNIEPIQSYIYVIQDFMLNGWYKEIENCYSYGMKGKINWNRTIKREQPVVSNNEFFYLDFITKKTDVKQDELFKRVHSYCIKKSFDKMGWLYTSTNPIKEKIELDKKLFESVIIEKMNNTFNDKNRELFGHLLAIVRFCGDSDSVDYKYGTSNFEYIWEKMIDKVLGIKHKDFYFPKTYWKIDGQVYENNSLLPDTIMLYDDDIYVIDAKYYKYGWKRENKFLPESTSINKQITYGEYIATENKFKKMHGNKYNVYNVFIMPYNGNGTMTEYIGDAYGDWKKNDKTYEVVKGILLDTKKLMKVQRERNESIKEELVHIINENV